MSEYPAEAPACREVIGDKLSVHDLGLDPVDLAVLTLQRHFFRSFAEPAAQGWIEAFAFGGAAFPQLARGEAALLVLSQVQALRCQRRSTFQFANPLCSGCARYLTADEVDLVGLLQAARARSYNQMQARAALLSGGTLNQGLETATGRLAEMLCPESKTPRFH